MAKLTLSGAHYLKEEMGKGLRGREERENLQTSQTEIF